MSPKLSVIALSIVPPIALLSRGYGRYVQKITKQVQDSLADATQVCGEESIPLDVNERRGIKIERLWGIGLSRKNVR